MNESCSPEWKIYCGSSPYGDRIRHWTAGTLQQCQYACVFSPRCVAVSWGLHECYIYTNLRRLAPNPSYNLYELVRRCYITSGLFLIDVLNVVFSGRRSLSTDKLRNVLYTKCSWPAIKYVQQYIARCTFVVILFKNWNLIFCAIVQHAIYRVAQIKVPHRTKCNFSTTVWDFILKFLDLYGRDPATILNFFKKLF